MLIRLDGPTTSQSRVENRLVLEVVNLEVARGAARRPPRGTVVIVSVPRNSERNAVGPLEGVLCLPVPDRTALGSPRVGTPRTARLAARKTRDATRRTA